MYECKRNTEIANFDLSIVIPAYNEGENLKFILPQLNSVLEKTGFLTEVLVIDTISPLDDTQEICLQNNATCIRRELSDNYCDAVKTGIKYAKGKKTIFMDADGSHSCKFILELLKYKDDYDLVIASRYIKGGDTQNNFILKLMSHTLNKTYSWVLGVKCKDISNSFKLYDTEMLKKLSLKCRNFDIIEEIIYKLVKTYPALKIKEVPFYFENRKFGKTKRKLLLFIIGYIFTLIKLRSSDF